MDELFRLMSSARFYDLAQSWFTGMPHHPVHPPFLFSLVKSHGEYTGPGGNSSASDAIALGTHVGTHIDALCHFSCGGRLHGGEDASAVQSYAGGLTRHSIDTIPPIARRGVLLDIAALRGGPLPIDYEITPTDLEAALWGRHCVPAQGVSGADPQVRAGRPRPAPAEGRLEIRPGDVVLLRTGWSQYFDDPGRFISQVHGPGPGLAGARWLSERGVFAAGSDTVAFEKVPDASMPVHVHLLVECGIHIIECLRLDDLAAAGIYEFLFIALPLKIRGATASPIRPVAVVTD